MTNVTSLTWKYFLEQKCNEIKEWIKYNIAGLIGSSLAFSLGFLLFGSILYYNEESFIQGLYLMYLGIGMLSFWILIGIIAIIKKIIKWLASNWKKAKGRAIQDIKNGSK